MNSKSTEWEKKNSGHISDKTLISKLYKKLLNSRVKKQNKKRKKNKQMDNIFE